MTKRTNSKREDYIKYSRYLVSVIGILNFEFIWVLVLVICFFRLKKPR